MVDSEKLSLCCSEEGRYLLLGDGGGGRGGGVEEVARGMGDTCSRGVRDGMEGDGSSEGGGVMRMETEGGANPRRIAA